MSQLPPNDPLASAPIRKGPPRSGRFKLELVTHAEQVFLIFLIALVGAFGLLIWRMADPGQMSAIGAQPASDKAIAAAAAIALAVIVFWAIGFKTFNSFYIVDFAARKVLHRVEFFWIGRETPVAEIGEVQGIEVVKEHHSSGGSTRSSSIRRSPTRHWVTFSVAIIDGDGRRVIVSDEASKEEIVRSKANQLASYLGTEMRGVADTSDESLIERTAASARAFSGRITVSIFFGVLWLITIIGFMKAVRHPFLFANSMIQHTHEIIRKSRPSPGPVPAASPPGRPISSRSKQ